MSDEPRRLDVGPIAARLERLRALQPADMRQRPECARCDDTGFEPLTDNTVRPCPDHGPEEDLPE